MHQYHTIAAALAFAVLQSGCAQVVSVVGNDIVIRHEAGMPRPDDAALDLCRSKGLASAKLVSTSNTISALGPISSKTSTYRCE